ncbi:glycosyltransferase family 4 protein [Flavobacterium sp.]|jgi:glycosyltransferase involved in cell wall biosynthesis|uniref:glycosyltransferase family 4 protein n=1 Tax=Flavobacterium sp. TaxID=239 RepID=UPI0037C03925
MHLCLITHEYPKSGFAHGGIGSFLKTLAPKLVAQGIEVTVVGLSYDYQEDYEEDQGVRIFRLGYQNVKRFGWFYGFKAMNKKIAAIHKENPIDSIESAELELAFLTKIPGIKYVIRLHGGHHFFSESEHRKIDFWKGFQEKISFKKADAFIAVSNYVKTKTNEFLSFHDKHLVMINYPIDVDFFTPKNSVVIKNSIVFVGSVCEKKGVRQLIQAFPLVKKQFPEATLEIYGRDWFFPSGKSYIEMLQETELPKLGSSAIDIHFQGRVNYENIPEIYAQAQVCVFPSHMETQGLVAPEAMAMEKLVVFTNQGPGPETITNLENGLLCNPFSPLDIADKICWAFSNEEKVDVICKNARKSVLDKYAAALIVQKNIDFYTKLIQ